MSNIVEVSEQVTPAQLRKAKNNLCPHWEQVRISLDPKDLRDRGYCKNRYGSIVITWCVNGKPFRTVLSAQIGRMR